MKPLLKTLLLMVGSAVAGVVIFVAGVVAFFVYSSSEGPVSFGIGERTEKVSRPPPLDKSEGFLGIGGSFDGKFKRGTPDRVLDAGPGEIVGSITVAKAPAPGIRIRLALNGSVMSEWARTHDDGKYVVRVPFGEYRIDGYELDHRETGERLGAKTDNPRNDRRSGGTFVVAQGKPGAGLDLDYIDPVRIAGPRGDVAASGPVVLTWKPYPGATAYRIQVQEFERPGDFRSERSVFDWNDEPVVEGTSLDLVAKGVKLKPGSYYLVHIDALDSSRATISTSGNRFATVDFHVTE